MQCDDHPLREGHVLIMPKQHLSCVGAFNTQMLADFIRTYERCLSFLSSNYGDIATFEHGIFGQTVFHSHVHLLPCEGNLENIISEGGDHIHPIRSFELLANELRANGGYLFVAIQGEMWLVDTSLAAPRFFRDRFANALGVDHKTDWRTATNNRTLREEFRRDNQRTIERWQSRKHMDLS